MVHGQSEFKDVSIHVVPNDVLPVGQPDEVPVQLLPLGLVALAMLAPSTAATPQFWNCTSAVTDSTKPARKYT